MTPGVPFFFRVAGELIINALAATLGTAMVATGLDHALMPHNIRGAFIEQILVGGMVAASLGFFVYFRWRHAVAKWLWIVGFVGLVVLIALHKSQTTFQDFIYEVTYTITSWRLLAYSAGAWACSAFMPLPARSQSTASPESPPF